MDNYLVQFLFTTIIGIIMLLAAGGSVENFLAFELGCTIGLILIWIFRKLVNYTNRKERMVEQWH